MEKEQSTVSQHCKASTQLKRAGGINDEFGGVDPKADAELIRLSGGP